MPETWDELEQIETAAAFDIETVRDRLKQPCPLQEITRRAVTFDGKILAGMNYGPAGKTNDRLTGNPNAPIRVHPDTQETAMTETMPSKDVLRHKNGVVDQRQQQIDPAGKDGKILNDAGPKRSQKQPGQDLGDPEKTDDNGE